MGLPLILLLTAACATPSPAAPPTAAAPGASAPDPKLAVFRGSVTLGGRPAGEGEIIAVQVNGVECGAAPVRGGRYELVAASDADRKGCGKPGDPVEFFLGLAGDPSSRTFPQKARWNQGVQQVDLVL